MRGYSGVWIALIVLATLAIFISYPLVFTGFFISVTGENASLALWDSADSQGGSYKVYAEGSPQGGGPSSTTLPNFFANYTNLTSGESINGSGIECNISFNLSGSWTSPVVMWFNSSSLLYEHNKSFDSRGVYYWNVTCDGSSQNFDVLNATDNITVLNTPAGIYVPLSDKTCYEDTTCNYDFSVDCYDIDDIDENNLTYSYVAGTEFNGFSMDSATGSVTVDITSDTDCGEFEVSLTVQDPIGEGAVANKTFIVNAVNDKPSLQNLPSDSYQNSSFYQDIDATDEETPSGPFFFNITFLECYRPFNPEHTNVTDCSNLFTIDNTTGEINRTSIFTNLDVGNYTINYTVTDPGDNLTGTSTPPYTWLSNETDSQVLNFSVIDINDPPVIDPVSNQFWSQNQSRTLVVNASDIDNGTLVFNTTTLYRNLSVYYNSSLFPIALNETLYLDNGTSLGNATMNYTPVGNSQVGNYTINVSVYDGKENGTYSILVNFTVTNINDPPNLNFLCNNYSVQGLEYYCDVGENTTDPDDFPSYVPYNDPVNGTITFEINFTYCNKTFNESDTNCSIFEINNQTGVINYTNPLRKDSGNYTLNVSVKDGGNLTDWVEFNFTVIPDYKPNITTSVSPQFTTQGQSLFLSINATDRDNATDNLTFITETYYNGSLLNDTLFPIDTDNSLWPPGPAMGVMNYTSVNNSQVGNYTVKIIVNDTWSREDFILVNFTVYNLNDPPVLNFSCVNYTYEDNEYFCNMGENTTDVDSETPYGETLTYNLTFISGPSLFTINSTTGVINFTASDDSWANNSHNFTYVLNISVVDSNNSIDWEEFNLTIHAVNDAPEFSFTNTTGFENSTFFMDLSLTATDEENDIPFYYNITFINCSRVDMDSNCSIFDVNNTTGVVNRTSVFTSGEVGNYTINVTVTDSGNFTQPYNATGWQLVDFKVLSINKPPSADIGGVIPSDTFYENETVLFAISVTDPDGDDLFCTWFRDGTQIDNVDYCQGDNSWQYTPDFDESGSWTIRLEVTDSYLTDYDTWGVTILNKNRPPEQIYPIQNQSWNMNSNNKNIILSYNFRDPDNENNVSNDDNNLTINYTALSHITVLIDGQTGPVNLTPANWTGKGVVTLTPDTDWYGLEYVVFTVNDSEFSTTSNNISLNVSLVEQEPEIQIITETRTRMVPSQARVASLTITVSPMERIGSYNETSANVTLENTGEVTLNGVNITAYVNESDEVSLDLSRVYVSQLGIGDKVNTTLTITTYELTKETYEIKVTGIVRNPSFNQSSTIYLRPIYGRTKIQDRISLAKDLFQDNPECLDLTELILEAERELGEDNIDRARELTESALENCRDIIKYTNLTKRKITPEMERIPINEIMIVFLSIALVSILVYLLLERRAEARRGGK